MHRMEGYTALTWGLIMVLQWIFYLHALKTCSSLDVTVIMQVYVILYHQIVTIPCGAWAM